VLGYPLITDIMSPWSVVHSVVPLAFPAAVGLALLYRWASGVDVDRPVRTTVAVVLVVALVGWTAGTAYDANVAAPDQERNEAFVHWTQPENELRYTLQTVARVSAENDDGYDVLFYGSRRGASEEMFFVPDESFNDRPPAAGGWYDRLPLPWYLERYDANVTSSPVTGDPAETLADPPPVVVAYAWDREEVMPHMDGYVVYRHAFKLYSEDILVFVDADYLDGYRTANTTAPARETPDTRVAV
jgi:predicted membrane-bound mannosyltransferase